MADKYYSICPKVRLDNGETFCTIRNTPCLGGAYRPDGDECLLLAKWKKEEEDRKILWEKLKEDDISSPPCPMRGELLSISTDTVNPEKTRYTYLCKANDEECLYDPYDGINMHVLINLGPHRKS